MIQINLVFSIIMVLVFGFLSIVSKASDPNRIIECKRNTPKAIWFTVEGMILKAYETGISNYTQETVYEIRLRSGQIIHYKGICQYRKTESPQQENENGLR
jgi:hypothetical protein